MKPANRLPTRVIPLLLLLASALNACTSTAPIPTSTVPPATEVPPPTVAPLPTFTPPPAPTDTPMPTFSPAEYEASGLGGFVWQWLRLDLSDGTTTVVPDPSLYTIQFLADGTYTGVADCNNFSGGYFVQGSSLQLLPGPMTLAACPPGSLSDVFVQRLMEVRTYVFDGADLVLNLMMDGGNMVFSKTPLAVLPTPASGSPSAVATANVNVRSGPSTSYPVYGVMPYGRSAEVVGKSQDGTWWVLKVNLAPQEQGWVSGDFVTVTGAENVPVIEAPPIPPSASFSGPDADDPIATALDALYVRSGPGLQYPAYGVAIPGQKAALIGMSQDGDWYLVRVNPELVSNGAAWVPAGFVQLSNADPADLPLIVAPPIPTGIIPPNPAPEAALVVAMISVNVRTGPGETYPILGVLQQNQAAPVSGINAQGTWWQIQIPPAIYAGGLAWVSASYVYPVNTQGVPIVAAPPPSPPPPSMPPPAGGSACSVIAQDPGNGTAFPVGTYFDVVWTIQNTSGEAWRTDSTDYRFGGAVNGVALHTGANDYDFPYTVEPGATVSIVINMQAPSTPGSYGETWMITTGATTSCQFDFVVSVQ